MLYPRFTFYDCVKLNKNQKHDKGIPVYVRMQIERLLLTSSQLNYTYQRITARAKSDRMYIVGDYVSTSPTKTSVCYFVNTLLVLKCASWVENNKHTVA